MRTVRSTGQMLVTVVKTILWVVLKAASCHRIVGRHVNLISCDGTGVLIQGVRICLSSKIKVILIRKISIGQAHALLFNNLL